jgi:hypothetical protein
VKHWNSSVSAFSQQTSSSVSVRADVAACAGPATTRSAPVVTAMNAASARIRVVLDMLGSLPSGMGGAGRPRAMILAADGTVCPPQQNQATPTQRPSRARVMAT